MNQVDIKIGRRSWKVLIPESWEECSPKLYRQVCWLLVNGKYDTPRMRRWLVRYTRMPRRAVGRMTDSEVNMVLQLLAWTLEPPKHASGKVGWWFLWRGPQAGFQNVDALQYGYADQAFQKYLEAVKNTDDREARKQLTELATHLLTFFGGKYRPAMAGVTRIAVRMMSVKMKMTVLYEFWGMTNFLAKHFPMAFSRRKKGGGKDYGWPGMYEAMAGDKFGPMSNVKREKIYDIFLHIEQSLQREREFERNKKTRKK